MPDNNGTVLEKYTFVHGKSLKSPWISFLEKCGNHVYMLWWSSKKANGWGWHPSNVNTLRPRQNGRHFPDDILKCIFLNENVWISIKISLKFDPKGPINNSPALIQIMAWRIYASPSLNEWTEVICDFRLKCCWKLCEMCVIIYRISSLSLRDVAVC